MKDMTTEFDDVSSHEVGTIGGHAYILKEALRLKAPVTLIGTIQGYSEASPPTSSELKKRSPPRKPFRIPKWAWPLLATFASAATLLLTDHNEVATSLSFLINP